jgi:hypothetical protein
LEDLKGPTTSNKTDNNKDICLQAAAEGKEGTTMKLLDGNQNHNSTNNITSSRL